MATVDRPWISVGMRHDTGRQQASITTLYLAGSSASAALHLDGCSTKACAVQTKRTSYAAFVPQRRTCHHPGHREAALLRHPTPRGRPPRRSAKDEAVAVRTCPAQHPRSKLVNRPTTHFPARKTTKEVPGEPRTYLAT
ncbi:uncharacterized protein LOC142592763 [Dermacentor variabilis]|uniref:uncharacterized protein LOC142592763 n=1 Tax=Dermacentor variabilis TaxID=34621 RepID=UPI003F5C1CDA